MKNSTQLAVGESVEFGKAIGADDIDLFAKISGDFDPIHVDEAYARTTAFGRRIAHGGLVMSLLSTTASMISRRSAERGSTGRPVSIGYDRIRFLKPVFVGDTLTARYTIAVVDDEAGRTQAKAEVLNQHGELCLVGTHVMKWVLPE
jgi:3-hydroxybutyryl-CoA dehydratase